MIYNKKFLFGLLVLGFLCSCTQTPQQRAKDATVLMVIGNADGTVSNGSGFFIQSDKIVTNIHVVDSARIVFAVGTKKIYNIEGITGYAPEHDLVILKVSGKGKPLELGEARIGDSIFVTGYPGGGYDETKGIVHGIRKSDKQLRLVHRGFPKSKERFLIPGNSGGPILNNKWEVIGIAVSSQESFSYASTSGSTKALLNSSNEENLSDWQQKDPIHAYIYEAWAKKKSDSKSYEEAIKGFDEAIKLYPHAEFYRYLGNAKVISRYQEAIQDYTDAIRLIPDHAIAYYYRGDAKQQTGDYAEAIEDFDKALQLNPDYADAYLKRGVAKVSMSEPDYVGAIQDYTEGINQHPEDPWNYYYNRGTAKIENPVRDYAGAIEDYTKAIRLKDDFAVAYQNRGLAKQKIDDYDGAIKDYTKVISLSSKNTKPLYLENTKLLARAYFRRGDAKKSSGKDGDPKLDHAKAYYYQGKANSNIGQYQTAVKSFDKSIALNPDYAVYYALGDAKRKIDDYEGAIQDYQKTINLKPDYAEAYYALGVTYFHLDNYKVALNYFEKAVKQKPKFAEAHYNLGLMQHRLAEHKVAIDHFSTAIKLKGELKEPVIYAKAYKARGEAKKALGEDEDAKINFAVAHSHWGDEAYKDRKYEEAIKNFDKILDLDPLAPGFAFFHDARGNAKTELGKSKAGLGDLEDALKLYQAAIEDRDKAIDLDPERALSYSYRGSTKFLRAVIHDDNGMIEDYQAAIEDFTKAVNRKSDLVDTYDLRGKARCLLGYAKANQGNSKEARKQYNLALKDFKEAINLSKKVTNSDTDNASYYYNGLGLANAALGKAKDALKAFEKAKQLKAEFGENK